MSNSNYFQNYFRKLAIFTIVIGLLFISYLILFPEASKPSKAIATFIVLFIVTSVGHYLSNKSTQNDPQKVIVNTLLAIVFKLVGYGVFAIILIMSDKQGVMPNITLFFILYLLFTAFDIYFRRALDPKK